MRIGWQLLLLSLAAASAFPQHQHSETAGSEAPLLSGLGDVNHPVRTSNPQAQRYFNQGLALIYGFNHEEAARSFRRAAELDPKCAMAFWGVALAVGPNYNDPEIDQERLKAAVEAIGKAQAVRGAPANEQAYIGALAKRYSLDPKADRKQLGANYSQAMGEVSKRYPNDLDAAVLYAESIMDLRPWQLWTADGQPAEGTEEALSVLRSVLARNPNHLGANHYYIHVTEASPHPEQALESAQRLKTLAPAAGHLVHMPAHVFMRTGDYHAASLANRKAAAADSAYIAKYHVAGMYPAMYYSHNLHFLAIAASMEGRFAEADAAAREVVERATPMAAQMPMAEWFTPTRLYVLVRFHKWQEILDAPEPPSTLHLAHAAWRFSRGMAQAGLKNLDAASSERDALAREVQAIPADTPFGFNTAGALFGIASNVLDASIARARGDVDGAVRWLEAAAQMEDKLNYDEPPDWYIPSREPLGAVLLAAGRAPEAEAVFREDLLRHPRNPRSLFGLAECLKREGKADEAARVKADFDSAWKNADTPIKLEEL
jgi:tetratricopeptide (TPR) repeat protein